MITLLQLKFFLTKDRIMNTRTLFISSLILAAAGANAQLYTLGAGYLATDASADGNVVAGYGATQIFMWTPSGGRVDIGGRIPGNGIGGDPSVSNDGTKIIAGNTNTVSTKSEAAFYTIANSTWNLCGSFGFFSGAESSSGWCVSGDGNVIGGLGWIVGSKANGFLYDVGAATTGSVGSTTTNSTRINDLNFDGSIRVGWQDASNGFRQAAIWNGTTQTLLTYNMLQMSEASAISDDGTSITGVANSSTGFQAWRWRASTGVVPLGTIFNSSWRGLSSAINGNGTMIAGVYRPFPGPATFGRGFLWIEGQGMIDMNTFATMAGANPGTLVLALPLGMSADGTTIVGTGTSSNGFVLKTTACTSTVQLQNFDTAQVTNQKVQIEVLDSSNTVLDTIPNWDLGPNGEVKFFTTRQGTYNIAFRGSHWLRKVITNVTIGATGAVIPTVSLINGDADGSNEVGPGDLQIILDNFDSNAAIGDLDGDGECGPGDLQIVLDNFGIEGE
jgi:hypothetical protein